MDSTLYYVHDPMCSWCWAFRPVWREIIGALPESVNIIPLLGGLAPDTEEPMSESMQRYLQLTWHKIQREVPGTAFNFDFWNLCRPRRSTYPACRSVIAAREQGPLFEEPMIQAIQQAYYLRAMNPSDVDALVLLAGEIGLNQAAFAREINSSATQVQLEKEIALARRMGVSAFPSLVVENSRGVKRVQHHYLDAGRMLEQIQP